MAITLILGFETGDTLQSGNITGTGSIQSTTKRTGGYAFRANPTAGAAGHITATSLAAYAARFYWRFASADAGNQTVARLQSTPFHVLLNGGSLYLATNAATQQGSSVAVVANTWYRIDLQIGTDLIKFAVDGVELYNATPTHASSGMTLGRHGFQTGAVDFYYDDILINDTGSTYPLGAGRSIARQPGAGLGTPTYNSWTKSSGSDAGALWDNTPFDTTDFCSATTAVAQTSFISPFSAGVDPIGTNDVVNGARVAVIAKTSATSGGGSACNIRRRYNGADTDTAITVTTSDAYYQEPIFSATLALLDAMEAGALNGGSTRVRTVEDVWVFVDYTPEVVAFLPRSRIPTLGPILAQ